jgi:hypothetical protein
MSCDDPGTASPGKPPDPRTDQFHLQRFGEHRTIAAGFNDAAVMIIAGARKQDADPGYRKDTIVGIGTVGGLQDTVALTASGIPIARSCSGGSLTTGSLRRSSPWP